MAAVQSMWLVLTVLLLLFSVNSEELDSDVLEALKEVEDESLGTLRQLNILCQSEKEAHVACEEPRLRYSDNSLGSFWAAHSRWQRMTTMVLSDEVTQIQKVAQNYSTYGKACYEQFPLDGECRPVVHVTFVMKSYSEIAINWARSLQFLSETNYIIICLDFDSCSSMKELLIAEPTIQRHLIVSSMMAVWAEATAKTEYWSDIKLNKTFSSLSKLWWVRTYIIDSILATGVDVVHSDNDVVWVAPLSKYLDFLSADIFAGQGTFPADVYEKWGTALCAGVVLWRSNTRVRLFLQKMLTYILDDTPDDQVALNRILARLDAHWPSRAIVPLENDPDRTEELVIGQDSGLFTNALKMISRHGITERFPYLRLALAHNDVIVRNCTNAIPRRAIVLHCWSSKKQFDKIQTFKSLGLWLPSYESSKPTKPSRATTNNTDNKQQSA